MTGFRNLSQRSLSIPLWGTFEDLYGPEVIDNSTESKLLSKGEIAKAAEKHKLDTGGPVKTTIYSGPGEAERTLAHGDSIRSEYQLSSHYDMPEGKPIEFDWAAESILAITLRVS